MQFSYTCQFPLHARESHQKSPFAQTTQNCAPYGRIVARLIRGRFQSKLRFKSFEENDRRSGLMSENNRRSTPRGVYNRNGSESSKNYCKKPHHDCTKWLPSGPASSRCVVPFQHRRSERRTQITCIPPVRFYSTPRPTWHLVPSPSSLEACSSPICTMLSYTYTRSIGRCRGE